MDKFYVLLCALAAAFGGISLGCSAAYDAWTTDCEQIGAHRDNKTVYTCARKQ